MAVDATMQAKTRRVALRQGTLETIVEHVRGVVAAAKRERPEGDVRRAARDAERCRAWASALVGHPGFSVIAEVKRQSPSAGLIRPEYAGPGFRPEAFAGRYHAGGARAISCLTEGRFFGGDLSFIARIRREVPLPVLRKDFLIDEYQVFEARAAGADAVLLIAECLDDARLVGLTDIALGLGMGVLAEIHGEEHLARVLPLASRGNVLLGINNRDLATMKVDTGHTVRLASSVPDRSVLVSESGLKTEADLDVLVRAGVGIGLIGEHLMREDDPGAALARLLGRHRGG